MALDEYGREPGVDYSSQTWTIEGVTYTDKVEVDIAQAPEEPNG